ncbi:MAG: NAD(+) diphosphatase [Candidatus Obscuribacterales bacterium]|nr:NAD(+) diphosphatase [Steroidobacteraceae bacterium]
MSLRNLPPNVLAGSYIDRAAHHRKDSAWIAQALNDPASLFVPVWRTRSLVLRSAPALGAMLIERQHEMFVALEPHTQSAPPTFLGLFRGRACFALGLDDATAPPAFGAAEFQELRTIVGVLDRDEAGLLAYARALITWRDRHRYCGKCGVPTTPINAGHAMRCTNTECRAEQFPRIDPAIIVLVTDGERALLGRQAAWQPGWYSTIAGFVETGESLEDAVAREVLEETGIEVAHVEYHSSQPWPFPQSLMLGFMARASTTKIAMQDDELEDVRWFTREEIAAGFPRTPPPISISGCLIEHWYDLNAPRPLREEPGARSWNVRPT